MFRLRKKPKYTKEDVKRLRQKLMGPHKPGAIIMLSKSEYAALLDGNK